MARAGAWLALAAVAQLVRWAPGHHGEINCPLVGVQKNFRIADLPEGWQLHYDAPYSDPTSLADVQPNRGDCMLMAAKQSDSSAEFALVAFGDRVRIEESPTVWDKDVYWYTVNGQASGFSSIANVDLRPGDKGPYQCFNRLSWLLQGDGGFRAGCTEDLENDNVWRKIVMYGPQAAFCTADTCPSGYFPRPDAPHYCRTQQCTLLECCMVTDTCRASVCSAGYQLKPGAESVACTSSACQREECCDKKPECQAADCPAPGFLLKEPRDLPGWCQDSRCAVGECCDAAPLCSTFACPFGLVHGSRLHCAALQCTEAECCQPASTCSAAICAAPFTFKTADLPAYCAAAACTLEECCLPPRPTFNVSDLAFEDLDLDPGELGGTLRWSPPDGNATVSRYTVYAGSSAEDRRLLGSVPWGTNELAVPMGTPAAAAFLVYTASGGGEQLVPTTAAISDAAYAVSGLALVDRDLDAGELGGTVSWTPPSLSGRVAHHEVLLVGAGGAVVPLGTLAMGTNELALAVDTPLGNFTRVQVFGRGRPAEQTLPAAEAALVDTEASASRVVFIDEEDPPGVVGGTITWEPPPSTQHVTAYHVYLDGNASSLEKWLVTSDLDAGASEAAVPMGTSKDNFTEVLVYTVSSLAEQSTPATAPISEKEDIVLIVMLGVVGSLGGLRAISVLAGVITAANSGGAADLEALDRAPAQLEHNPVDVPVTGTYASQDMEVVIRHMEVPCVRALFSSLFPSCVHPNHRKIVLHRRGSSTCLHRHSQCKNSWYGDGMLVRKLANNVISVSGLREKKVRLERKRRLCPRRLSLRTMDAGLRAYLPLAVIIGIAAAVASLGEVVLGIILFASAFMCLLALVSFPQPGSTLSICFSSIQDLPPARIRRHFWHGAELLVALLPCAPAFLSGTDLGVATGAVAIMGAVLCFIDFGVLASWFEIAAGLTFAAMALVEHYSLKAYDRRAAGVMTAVFLTASLILVKGIDGVLKQLMALYANIRLPDDPLVAEAQKLADATGLSTVRAMAVEAFTTAELEVCMQDNFIKALQSLAHKAVDLCNAALERANAEMNSDAFHKVGQTLDHYMMRAQAVVEVAIPLSQGHAKAHMDELHSAFGKLHMRALGEVTIRRCRENLSRLSSACHRLEEMLGIISRITPLDDKAGHRVSAKLWGLHMKAVTSMAKDVNARLPKGTCSTLEFGRLNASLEVMRERATRGGMLLDGLVAAGLLPEEAPHGNVGLSRAAAKTAMDGVEEALDLACRHFSSKTKSGKATTAENKAISELFSGLIEDATEIEQSSHRLQDMAIPISEAEVDDFSPMKVDPEVRELIQVSAHQCQDPDFLETAATSVSVLRNVAAIAGVVLDEVQSVIDRAERAVQTLLDAKTNGQRAVEVLRRAHQGFATMPVSELQAAQDLAAETLGGSVVSAVVRTSAVGTQDRLGRLQEHVKEELTRAKLPLWASRKLEKKLKKDDPKATRPQQKTQQKPTKATSERHEKRSISVPSKPARAAGSWRMRKVASDPSQTFEEMLEDMELATDIVAVPLSRSSSRERVQSKQSVGQAQRSTVKGEEGPSGAGLVVPETSYRASVQTQRSAAKEPSVRTLRSTVKEQPSVQTQRSTVRDQASVRTVPSTVKDQASMRTLRSAAKGETVPAPMSPGLPRDSTHAWYSE